MITYLFAVIFSFAFVLLPHRKDLFGFIIAAAFFVSMFFHHQWQDVVLAAVASVWLITISTNVFILQKSPFYLDRTKPVNRIYGNGKWICLGIVLAVAILIRVFN